MSLPLQTASPMRHLDLAHGGLHVEFGAFRGQAEVAHGVLKCRTGPLQLSAFLICLVHESLEFGLLSRGKQLDLRAKRVELLLQLAVVHRL